jgi:formylglycine-generating enzyme required for sulfatase activity
MSLKLYKNNIDEYKVSDMGRNNNFKAPGSLYFEKKNPFNYNDNVICFEKGAAFDFFNGEDWNQLYNDSLIEFDPLQNLDVGNSYDVGSDYFIYLCLQGSDPVLVVSKNSTFPNGFNANNSRKIGGFHYGSIRKVTPQNGLFIPIDSNGVKFGSSGIQWQNNVTLGIIPNSVWDLKNRPRILFGGMVKVGSLWMSIYQASVKAAITYLSGTNGLHIASGELQSKYGQLPVTGTEGMNQYTFNEIAQLSGMRLPRYSEWLAAAFGSPQGNDEDDNNGWTKTTNSARTRTGCSVNALTGEYDSIAGVKPYAISAYNCVDCAGNVWEWLSDYAPRYDADTGAWIYRDQLGDGMGKIYAWKDDGFVALIAGGSWTGGARCGSRTVHLNHRPWGVSASVGARLACDAAA